MKLPLLADVPTWSEIGRTTVFAAMWLSVFLTVVATVTFPLWIGGVLHWSYMRKIRRQTDAIIAGRCPRCGTLMYPRHPHP